MRRAPSWVRGDGPPRARHRCRRPRGRDGPGRGTPARGSRRRAPRRAAARARRATAASGRRERSGRRGDDRRADRGRQVGGSRVADDDAVGMREHLDELGRRRRATEVDAAVAGDAPREARLGGAAGDEHPAPGRGERLDERCTALRCPGAGRGRSPRGARRRTAPARPSAPRAAQRAGRRRRKRWSVRARRRRRARAAPRGHRPDPAAGGRAGSRDPGGGATSSSRKTMPTAHATPAGRRFERLRVRVAGPRSPLAPGASSGVPSARSSTTITPRSPSARSAPEQPPQRRATPAWGRRSLISGFSVARAPTSSVARPRAAADPGRRTTNGPIARRSTGADPKRSRASRGSSTIGRPRCSGRCCTTTGAPVRSSKRSSTAATRGSSRRSTVWIRAVPSTWRRRRGCGRARRRAPRG